MDQIQQSLCDMTKRKPACLTDRTILRSALADYLPSNKLKQNLLLNAFDNDVVQSLRKGSDVTLSALNCISQLENDYGITKDVAFWSIQTWCYLLGLDTVADALVVLQPINKPNTTHQPVNVRAQEVTVGFGVYRAGTDFPAGDISVQITSKPKYKVYYGVGKNPNRINADQSFMDKIYVHLDDGQFIKIENIGSNTYSFVIKSVN